MMVEKVFSRIDLLNRIEQVHGKKIVDFGLRFPIDYRCKPQLHIYCELSGDDRYALCWMPACEAYSVERLIKMNVVTVKWNEDDSAHFLTVVVREEGTK